MRIFIFTLLLITQVVKGQSYPQNFRNPLDINMYLAGNFAELRGFHFHAGIDIKTNQREGLNVYAVEDGYVSRINVSPRGYGNSVYITHPNGYTTLYAHLSEYKGDIAKAIRDEQYRQKKFEVDYYLPKDSINVKKGDVIALSGNSGSSGGPHLHFEVRDTKTEEIINPFLFGYNISDHRSPLLKGMYIYAINGEVAGKQRYDLVGNKNYNIPVYASGKVGIGVKAYDQLDGAHNMNGVYQIKILCNQKKIFEFIANKFSFDETRFINTQTDYAQYMHNKSWIYKGFKLPGNSLQMIKTDENDGYIEVKNGESYDIEIVLTDYSGNTTKGSFKIKGKPGVKTQKIEKNENFISWNKENYIQTNELEMWFPKGSFYEDFNLDYRYKDGKYYIHHDSTPLHKFYTLAIQPKNIPIHQLNKAVIAVEYHYGNRLVKDFFPTVYKNGKLIAEVRDFGTFSIVIDEEAPKITPINMNNGAVFDSKRNLIKFKIRDDLSGIKNYSAYIDDQWVLGVYDKKSSLFTINLEKEGVKKGKHTLDLIITDGKHNKATYHGEFNKTN